MTNEKELIEEVSNERHSDSFCPENPARDASSEHFSLEEFRCDDGTEVPIKFRGNIQELMDNLEIIRAEFDKKIYIRNGYRTPEYNQTKIKEPKQRSRHMCGQAADIVVEDTTPDEVYSMVEYLMDLGKIKPGGLHKYSTGFVHYDIRGTKQKW